MNFDKITYICEKLGLGFIRDNSEGVTQFILIDMSSEFFLRIGREVNDPRDLLIFAAIVKAAMAKRGILPYYDERYGKYDHVLFHKGDIESGTKFHFFDPTDPISEANALIDAIYAALEMETTT